MPNKKSRGGCGNCKQKKIKCDETKPSCQRCMRLNQICLGYSQGFKWSDKHEIFRTRTKNSPKVVNKPKSITNDAFRACSYNDSYSGDYVDRASNLMQDQGYIFDEFSLPTDETSGEITGTLHPLSSFSPLINAHETVSLADIQLSRDFEPISFTDQELSTGLMVRHQSFRPQPTVPQNITHHDTLLTEYYFKAVATLYSCFDGDMNPFRATIGKLWDSSLVTKLTMQSMAAACLSRDFPHLANEGKMLRSQALIQINDEVQMATVSDISFLCLVMLGQSSGWHYTSDLGLQQYNDARRILSSGLLTSSQGSKFFTLAMDYWRMILSFVSGSNFLAGTCSNAIKDDLVFQTIPHPWALIAPEMMQTISEVGKLVFEHRQKFRSQNFWRQAQFLELQAMTDRCRVLEHELMDHTVPLEAEIVDPGDMHTPRSHLVEIAEAYRFVALIQLYRVFPDVLLDRVKSSGSADIFSKSMMLPVLEERQATDEEAQAWLKRLVLHTMKILTSIPFESNSRSIQAFLYVALSSELRKSPKGTIDQDTLQIVQARHFIQGRLEAYRFVFAPKPAQRKLDLVLKIWEQMDTFDKPSFWIDVMLDHNLEVVFC